MAQTIEVSDEVFERLSRAAGALRRPIRDVAEQALATGLPPDVDDVPAAFRGDLIALEELPDEALWQVLRDSSGDTARTRHEELLARNSAGNLSAAERAELTHARDEADRVVLRRAHAAALLRWRGHVVPREP
jgi:hypothetical protein